MEQRFNLFLDWETFVTIYSMYHCSYVLYEVLYNYISLSVIHIFSWRMKLNAISCLVLLSLNILYKKNVLLLDKP